MRSAPSNGPSPGLAVARELGRTLIESMLLPFEIARYIARRDAQREALIRDLETEGALFEPAPLTGLPDRPLRIFVSCAEASGETHAANLVDALRAELRAAGAPEPRIQGLGTELLASRGVEILGSPGERAAMGFSDALSSLPYYLRLIHTCARGFRDAPPDVFVPVDSPSLHMPLAHIARSYSVPTVHFVTPQHWAWAPWRAKSYRKAIVRALSILPFEPAWFARHGIDVCHVGHPILDAQSGVTQSVPPDGSRTLAVLPGSRRSVIRRNLPWMLEVLSAVRPQLGEVELVVAQQREENATLSREIIESAGLGNEVRVECGELHEQLARARTAFSVSGTVLLQFLPHRLPFVTMYRSSRLHADFGARYLLTPPWFASINLLARRELCPEFPVFGDGPRAEVAAALLRAHQDDAWRAEVMRGLDEVALRLGPAGACRRAAAAALEVACRSARARGGAGEAM